MNLNEGLKKFESLPRDQYFEENQRLAEDVWDHEKLPTVGDIADFMQGKENDNMMAIFDFFENEESFMKMANRQGAEYTEDESREFIQSVMSSNNTDISKAGYFYKLLMASADDFIIVDQDCESDGVEWKLDDITEDNLQFRIRYQWVNEFKQYFRGDIAALKEKCKELGIDTIHVRTPLTCNCFPRSKGESDGKLCRGICKKCAGLLPAGTVNVGAFTTLMVTEHATQGALNSMNKGVKKDVNDMLTQSYHGEFTWNGISEWIESIRDDLSGDKVFGRFYEIALMSRIRFDEEGPYVSSFISSIARSGNLFGAYIFTPDRRNFENMLKEGSFDDQSLKLQIAMNIYERR